MRCCSYREVLSPAKNAKHMTSQRNLTPAAAVTLLRQEIRSRTQIVRTLLELREQIDNDRICGAWLSADSNLTAAIRRSGRGTYRLLVFDNALCYKRLVQDALIVSEAHALHFAHADDPRDRNVVRYDADSDVLLLGCYGRFVPEAHEQGSLLEEFSDDAE